MCFRVDGEMPRRIRYMCSLHVVYIVAKLMRIWYIIKYFSEREFVWCKGGIEMLRAFGWCIASPNSKVSCGVAERHSKTATKIFWIARVALVFYFWIYECDVLALPNARCLRVTQRNYLPIVLIGWGNLLKKVALRAYTLSILTWIRDD